MVTEKRFAAVVRFECDWLNPSEYTPAAPIVYWHSKPKAAARRLASLISRSSKPGKSNTLRLGTKFYIVDHESPDKAQESLTAFRTRFGL